MPKIGEAIVVPAYGRDYKSAAAALKDWHDGKDFKVHDVMHGFGMYTSKRDWLGKSVIIRYNKMTQAVVVK